MEYGPLIDYYGDSAEDEATPNTFQGLKSYWMGIKKKESGGSYEWTIKDQTLLSRLIKTYEISKIVKMMESFLRKNPGGSFGYFYKVKADIHNQLFKPDNYGFD